MEPVGRAAPAVDCAACVRSDRGDVMQQEVHDTPDGYRFPVESPAGRYWLVHGRGFTLCRDGRKIGVVEEVLVDPLRQGTRSVTIRRARFGHLRRRETIDASHLEAVVPSARLLFVAAATTDARASARERVRPHAVALGARAAASSRRGASSLRPAGSRLLQLLASMGAAAAGLARRAANTARRATLASIRWLAREAPAARAQFAAGAGEAGLIAQRVLTALAHAARVGALHVLTLARAGAGRLREAAVELVLLAAAAWRRLLYPEAGRDGTAPTDVSREGDVNAWHADADTALGRDIARADAADPQEEQTPGTIVSDPGSGR